MEIALGLGLGLVLMAMTLFIHYETLGWLNGLLPHLKVPHRSKLLLVIIVAFVAHVVEIAVYGLSMYAMTHVLHVGTLTGTVEHDSLGTYLYFSAVTYTSLGFGDLSPVGAMRILSGIEALNGLLLIGWSASFTYLAMERYWAEGKSRRLRK